MHIWWFLKFVVDFLWKAYQTLPPFQNFPTGQAAMPGKYYEQKLQHFNKTAACNHYWDSDGYMLAWTLSSLWHLYTRVYLWIYDPGPSILTTFLGLCSPMTTGNL